MIGRCQICGRRRGQRKDGGLVRHYVRGLPCEGEGFSPIEIDDSRLADLVSAKREAWRAIVLSLKALRDRRANWIDPQLEIQARRLWSEASKLERRLNRHRSWPARFAREMERQGWGSPPPAYLIARAAEASL